MGRMTIKVNPAGVVALLKSGEVQADLARRAAGIEAQLPTDGGEEWATSSFIGFDRAQATVRTANIQARKAAAEDNALQRALGGGR